MTKSPKLQKLPAAAWHHFINYWRAGWWHKTWLIIVLVIVIIVGAAFGLGKWYESIQPPQQAGVSFIPDYASYLGVGPKETLSALENIGVKNFRLVSYWEDIEPSRGHFDFSQLDWQFKSIEKSGGKISLAIGLRQPRWPECHAPSWVDTSKPAKDWQPALENFMAKVIDRYKNSPALESYQLENEFFNAWGPCRNTSRGRLIQEYQLVKKLDPGHPIIITRSNKYPNLPTGQPRPDIFGEEIYRSVWNPLLNRFFTYPLPAWYYSFLAGATKLATGRDSILTEVQAEPWIKPGKTIFSTSLEEQNQTFNAKIFESNINLARKSGLSMAYYWGASYWYYRWQVLHDKSVWTVAEQLFGDNN